MSKQLNVDLNELINFNYNKFTLEEKQKLTAKITALSLFLLDKKGQYQVPSEVNVDFDESLEDIMASINNYYTVFNSLCQTYLHLNTQPKRLGIFSFTWF